MQIGWGKKMDGSERIRFDVKILGMVTFAIEIEANPEPGDKRPDFLVYFGNERAGALWSRTPQAGGEKFLSGNIESPVFPGGVMDVAVFKVKEGDRVGQYDLTWRPPPKNGGGNRDNGSASEF